MASFWSAPVLSLTWFGFFQEESAEAEDHGLPHLPGHPAPAVRLRGNLQPPQAAAAHAHEGLPTERRGGHHGRHLRPGARWVLAAVLLGLGMWARLEEPFSRTGATRLGDLETRYIAVVGPVGKSKSLMQCWEAKAREEDHGKLDTACSI